MNFSSRLQILKVETTPTQYTDKVTGAVVMRCNARCILLDDSGAVVSVGLLRVPKDLQAVAKEGVFRAAFALQVPDWGDDQGRIVAVLTGLTAESGAKGVRVGAPSPAPVAA